MNGRVLAVVCVLVVAAGLAVVAVPAGAQESSDCSLPVTVTDATGTEVTVPAEPERIVALGPSAAQQLWAIDADDRVVGMPVDQYTDYLADREGVENVVGDEGQPVQEAVVGLDPDLVLAPNIIDEDTVESLRGADLTVYRYRETRSLADVSDEIGRTGRLIGDCESAATVSADMEETVAAIGDAVGDEERPRVYYDLGGGWTAGPDTFVGDLIETAGGDNVATEAGIDRYDAINQEVITDADPEVIVVHEGAEVPSNPAVDNSTAIREGNVVRVDANFINQPGPRNVIPLREMAEAFHPEAMAGGTGTPTDAATPTVEADDPTADGATTDGTTGDGETPDGATGDGETTDGGDGPGFTVVATAVALVVAGLLVGRRR